MTWKQGDICEVTLAALNPKAQSGQVVRCRIMAVTNRYASVIRTDRRQQTRHSVLVAQLKKISEGHGG
jgi:hypothetical protein